MTYLEAEYKDGYIHSELELSDVSPYAENANIFNDILEKRPEADHGRLVRFSLIHENHRYSVDWTTLPDNARPIRYMNMESDLNGPEAGVRRIAGIGFGYQYVDEQGKSQQEVITL